MNFMLLCSFNDLLCKIWAKVSCWVYIVVMEISYNLLIIFVRLIVIFGLSFYFNELVQLFVRSRLYLSKCSELNSLSTIWPPQKGWKNRRAVAWLFFHNFITFIMVILVMLVPSLKFCAFMMVILVMLVPSLKFCGLVVNWLWIGCSPIPSLCICNIPITICVISLHLYMISYVLSTYP